MKDSLRFFLNCGYFPDYQPKLIVDLRGVSKSKYCGVDEGDLLKEAKSIFMAAMENCYVPGETNFVPISGGLDSRAILSALLEFTDASRINTYTFGTPGTLDYEIGSLIGRELGTVHKALDLTRHKYTQDELEDVALRVDHQTLLFHHWPARWIDSLSRGGVTWSGFLGDPLSGSHLPSDPAASFDSALHTFFKSNVFVTSTPLSAPPVRLDAILDTEQIAEPGLSYEEQLDLLNRQVKYIAPLVLMDGYSFKTPFLYKPWVDFILSVPDEFRRKQRLYKRMLTEAFPLAFSYGTKGDGGLALGAPVVARTVRRILRRIRTVLKLRPREVNYLDFHRELRKGSHFYHLVASNVRDLKDRGVLPKRDLERQLANYPSGYRNSADALIVLASLEIHLKSGMALSRIA